MSTLAWVLVAVALGLAAIIVAATVLLARLQVRRGAIRWTKNERTEFEQYSVATPAGPAVVTKVWDARGPAYEIETSFHGQPTRLHYVAPARAVVERRLRALVAEHQGERAA